MDTRLLHVLYASFVLLVHLTEVFAINKQVGNASVRCLESERQSLLALKQGFVDPNHTLSSWGNGENQKECCNWEGVSCDNQGGHVVKLAFTNYGLEGTITPSLAELHYLEHLDLSSNNVNLTEFPKFVTSLIHLKYLDLSSMNLKGKIPYELGDLFHLQELLLVGNQLEGGLPKSLELCHLYKLDLSSNNLSGRLNDFVAPLSCANKSLEYLDLSHNQIVGSIPDLSQFSSLKLLSLAGNQLNGTLSNSIGLLSSLLYLSIAHNSLKGVISETHFLRLSKLKKLDLAFNHLVFNISSNWVPPFQIYVILLASCKLGPTFPTWLQSQKNCSWLDISNVEISDTIPNWFWDIPFRKLNLSHNQIIGKIPNFSFSLYAREIDLNSNLFEGPIPSNLSNVVILDLSNNNFSDASNLLCPKMTTNLVFLDLSNNQLVGVLPNCWAYFKSLVFLSVANNSLFGKIPTSMSTLGKIQALHFGNNRFVGEIPLALNKCTELRTFDAGQNNLSGLFPSWIGDGLKMLRVLILRSNMFFGSLPYNICHLSQVQILDLSKNNFSGSLPKCFNNLSALASKTSYNAASSIDINSIDLDTQVVSLPLIDSSANTTSLLWFYLLEGDSLILHNSFKDSASLVWKGKESKYQSILGLVKSIDLSSNMLIGEIPSEVMDLVGLISLNLSRNKIGGKIPPAIGRLQLLDTLDLSRNHLFGRIPSELSHIDRLSVMDLSYNNLSGEIPHGTQLQSFDASSYMGNFDLCGAPLFECLTKLTGDNQNDGNLKDDEQVLGQGFYISLTIGFSTGFWGVCSLLFYKKSWRYAYFKFWSDIYDRVYVIAIINMAKLRRWIGAST